MEKLYSLSDKRPSIDKVRTIKPLPLHAVFYEQYCAYEEWIGTGRMPEYFKRYNRWQIFKRWFKKIRRGNGGN